jgi:hypothetical protein
MAQRFTAGALAYRDDDCMPLVEGHPCALAVNMEPVAPAIDGISIGICRKWNTNCCRQSACRMSHLCTHCLQDTHPGWQCQTPVDDCWAAQIINNQNEPNRWRAQGKGSYSGWGRGYSGGRGKGWW